MARPLGTMVTYGFPRGHLETDLALANRLGATHVEVLPDWRAFPDPIELREILRDRNFILHSAHGCWGGQSILAPRVDLGHPDLDIWQQSLDDLRRCLDWLAQAGGTHLVVHPGGLSDPEFFLARRRSLLLGLLALSDHVKGNSLRVCVENMPPGVHPGSTMSDLADLVTEVNRPEIALALDTGHANLTSTLDHETRSVGPHLLTTHVHDNNGQLDSHLPPGYGTIDWTDWVDTLDQVGYAGPIMLECIRHLREHPDCIDDRLLEILKGLAQA